MSTCGVKAFVGTVTHPPAATGKYLRPTGLSPHTPSVNWYANTLLETVWAGDAVGGDIGAEWLEWLFPVTGAAVTGSVGGDIGAELLE